MSKLVTLHSATLLSLLYISVPIIFVLGRCLDPAFELKATLKTSARQYSHVKAVGSYDLESTRLSNYSTLSCLNGFRFREQLCECSVSVHNECESWKAGADVGFCVHSEGESCKADHYLVEVESF